MPALIALGSSGQAVATAPISPPEVSLAYQPPGSPRDWRVPTPKSPQVIREELTPILYVRDRYIDKQDVPIRTIVHRFFAVKASGRSKLTQEPKQSTHSRESKSASRAWFKSGLQLRGGWGRRPKGNAPRSEASALGARWLLPARSQPPNYRHLHG